VKQADDDEHTGSKEQGRVSEPAPWLSVVT
jgi:hypothetical protein